MANMKEDAFKYILPSLGMCYKVEFKALSFTFFDSPIQN